MIGSLRPLAGATLALVLLLTSLTVAAARGQTTPAGEMVLCLGGHAVTVTVDADGNPVEYTHICSDFAMTFFVDAGGAFVPGAPVSVWTTAYLDQAHERSAGRDMPQAQARGPPLVV
ncbi:MAG: hypothetical protein N4A61_09580 [Pelagimonas sp.]|jgi:hypothetical protein|nr:hypothetical protein [Pelagimonas sp.]